jgi:hypothetical protein
MWSAADWKRWSARMDEETLSRVFVGDRGTKFLIEPEEPGLR